MGRSLRLGVVAAVLGAGCATAGPAGGARADRVGRPFDEVRVVALFRPPAREERRGKDVLDGLAETLVARGFTVRTERTPEVAARLEDLWWRLEAWAGPSLEARGAVLVGVYEGAGEVVRAAGVDAVAFAYRFARPMPSSSLLVTPGGAPRSGPPSGALGALVLASARDDVVRVEWGSAEGLEGAGPANPAEAIEAVVGVLLPGEGTAPDGATPAVEGAPVP